MNDKLTKLNEKYPDFKIHCFGRAYAYRMFYNQLVYDTMWSLLSSVSVHAYVTWHGKSLFVSSTALSMILFSFPITLVIYRNIFGITNVSSLHLMIVFVVLGISADNIFVLWDAWK